MASSSPLTMARLSGSSRPSRNPSPSAVVWLCGGGFPQSHSPCVTHAALERVPDSVSYSPVRMWSLMNRCIITRSSQRPNFHPI